MMSLPLDRRFLIIVALLAAMLTLCSAPASSDVSFVPGRLLVKFSPRATQNQVRGLLASAGARSVGQIPQLGVHVIQLPDEADEVALANAFNRRPEVAFAELDAVVSPSDVTPNDSYYKSEWHLPKIGAPSAWSTTTGSSSVIVA